MIETKKLTDLTLKRITKSDNTYEDVHITDVPSNVISNGTNITDQVLENINYKDDQSLEFSKLINNNIPTPQPGKCIIYSTSNGKLYCAISGYNPFEISAVTVSDIIKKKGITYVSNGALEYFNLNNEMKLFSNSTKLGATPTRTSETNVITDATYFDIIEDEITGLISGNEKIKIQENNIIFNNLNTEIKMDSNNKITIKSGTSKLEINSNGFNIQTPSTNVELDSSNNVFNCHTSLSNASYGNNKYRVLMGDNLVIKNNINNNTLLTINTNGEIYVGNISLENYIKTLAASEIRRYKQMIQTFNGSSTYIDDYFLCDKNYVFYFSDTENSNLILSFEIYGLDIRYMVNNKIYIPKTNSYYYLEQYEATYVDGDDIDTLYIYKANNGNHTPVYFRQVYEEVE